MASRFKAPWYIYISKLWFLKAQVFNTFLNTPQLAIAIRCAKIIFVLNYTLCGINKSIQNSWCNLWYFMTLYLTYWCHDCTADVCFTHCISTEHMVQQNIICISTTNYLFEISNFCFNLSETCLQSGLWEVIWNFSNYYLSLFKSKRIENTLYRQN